MAVLNPYNYAKPKGAVVSRPHKPFVSPTATNKQNQQQNNSDQYLEQKVMAASPQELTLMLYEGVIKFIKQAKIFNDEKMIEKTSNAILRAEAIFGELRATLNMEYEVSNELDTMYEYVLHRLSEANIQKSNEILDEVLELSVEFRDTWKEAMKRATEGATEE